MIAQYWAFEGIDGSGKTKQLGLLHQYLINQGYKVLLTREFGSPHNDACVKIREFALDSSYNFDDVTGQFMFAACSTQHNETVIKPNMQLYDFIISDRSIESNLAYCVATGIDRAFAHKLFFLDERRLYPSKIIYLNADPEICAQRLSRRTKEIFSNGGEDRIESKGIALQRKVKDEYAQRIEVNSAYVVIESAYLTVEQTHAQILEKLKI